MTRDDLRCRLAYPNVRAFLAILRAALNTSSPAGYRTRADGAQFHGWHHPAIAVPQADGNVTTRAGAYRIHHRVWEAQSLCFGFKDFSPDCQDEAAVAILDLSGALGDLMSGHFMGALTKARDDWPELPARGQPGGTIPLHRAIEIYELHGGQFLPSRAMPITVTRAKRCARAAVAFAVGLALGIGLALVAAWPWVQRSP